MAASFTSIRPENALTKMFTNANCMDIKSAMRKLYCLMNVMSDCTLQEVARENQTEQDLLQFMKAE